MRIEVVTLGTGGMLLYASQLCNALSKKVQVHAVIAENAGRGVFADGVNIIPVLIPPKSLNVAPLRLYHFLKTVRSATRELKPDIVHITAIHPWLIFGFPFWKRYPLVATIHDVKGHPGDAHPVIEALSWLIKRTADKLVVHGELLRQQLIEEGLPADKVEVVPHGDYSYFTKYEREGIEEENTILFFGRILDYKGLEYLIKAEPLIRKALEDVKIVIAGEGDFSKYRGLVSNESSFVVLNRYIPDQEVAPLFQKAKVIVLPYIEASQSGVIPIAYAFKKPVVVTSVGSIPEVVEHGRTGYIVPPKDPGALASAIVTLLKDDSVRKQMGENGYRKMVKELSWDAIAAKTVTVYEKAIRAHNSKKQ